MSNSLTAHVQPRQIGIVVPLYNEAEGFQTFHQRLCAVLEQLPYRWAIWYIDDGSQDQTAAIVSATIVHDARVELLQLSRNFGHQIALTAGLDHAKGDIIITMDGDGQHPPELLPRLIEQYLQGYDIVLTQRIEVEHRYSLKTITSRLFYQLINYLSETEIIAGSADFRLMSHDVVLNLRHFREQHRFIRGLIIWMGYKRTVVRFETERRIAGVTKYSARKMLRLASDAIFSFSTLPLKLAILLGSVLVVIASIEALYTLYFFVSGQRSLLVPGWASLMFVFLGIGGVQLIILGVIGQYIGLIFQEVKHRPLYLLRQQQNVAESFQDNQESLHERIA